MKAPGVGAIALPGWQRRAIYLCVALLVMSGVAWLVITWPGSDSISPTARTVAAWLLRLHGIVAYGALVVVGAVLPVHLRLGWVKRRNRISGSILVAIFALLAVSGLWLYYGGEAGRDAASLAHWSIGLALPQWVVLHRAWGLRARRA